MQLDAKATAHTPSRRPTVPRLNGRRRRRFARTPHRAALGRTSARRSVVHRRSPWCSTSGQPAGAVVLAQWWITGRVDDRNVLVYSWVFVPFVVRRPGHPVDVQAEAEPRFPRRLRTRGDRRRGGRAGDVDRMLMCRTRLADPATSSCPYVRPSELVVRLWVCAAILMPAVRLLQVAGRSAICGGSTAFGAPALIVGSGPIAHQLITRMRQVPDYGLRPVGMLDDIRPADAELVRRAVPGHHGQSRTRRARNRAPKTSSSRRRRSSDEQLARAAQRGAQPRDAGPRGASADGRRRRSAPASSTSAAYR